MLLVVSFQLKMRLEHIYVDDHIKKYFYEIILKSDKHFSMIIGIIFSSPESEINGELL